MDAINLSDLRREIDTLIDRIEAGDSVDIVRDGRPFARITPTPPVGLPMPAVEAFDFDALTALRRGGTGGGVSVEDMRRRDLL